MLASNRLVIVGAVAVALGTVACGGGDSAGKSKAPGVEGCPTPGETRDCTRSNDFGTCTGLETCGEDGSWSTCNAVEPAREECNGVDDNCNGEVDEATIVGSPACSPSGSSCDGELQCRGEEGIVCVAFEAADEVCDLVDNDCDGEADEDFRDNDGLYADPDHCGACGNACADVFPTATKTECRIIAGNPRCVATECPQGTNLAPGGLGCVALSTRLCEPCATDSDCSASLGDRCVDYGGGDRYCGRDCSSQSVFGVGCPTGFVCDGAAEQCVVAGGGSCQCGPSDGFEKPCSYEDPANAPGKICAGTQTCSAGSLGDCLPPDETCNGVDDDCNGVVDDGFVDPTTKQYSVDPHNCGACGIDCDALFGDPMFHAAGRCEAVGGEVPKCQPDCEPGFADANRAAADGCECTIQDPSNDMPDVNGVDADCDGIDGQIPRGIFVSTTGDDSNPGTRREPVRTIQHGIDLAAASATFDHVYVAEGIYEESITLASGESIFGGYSPDFSEHDPRAGTTVLIGETPTGAEPGTVNAFGIGDETHVDGFVVRAAATPTAFGNSYAVYVQDSGQLLEITNNRIVGGAGAPGGGGANGADGNDATASAGTGGPARAIVNGGDFCDAGDTGNRSPGGSGASFSCAVEGAGSVDTSGGGGGAADCPEMGIDPPEGTGALAVPEASGGAGSPAGIGGPGGNGGYNDLLIDGSCAGASGCVVLVPLAPAPQNATEAGLPGGNGSNGADGSAGSLCAGGRGTVVGGEWQSPIGTKGVGGLPGGGGGGGGAGGGVDRNDGGTCDCPLSAKEAIGGGGGGGGAGGCGGFGGKAGGSGGGSFAVFVVYNVPATSLPVIRDNTIERGFGGAGGAGGAGGKAGAGGSGAAGGAVSVGGPDPLVPFAAPGGRGGDGGRGGFGGGGAGGCGGASVGVYFSDTNGLSAASISTDNAFPAAGAAGPGGNGGPSVGNSGPAGADGLYAEVSP